jgi:hypothetical protein
MTFKRGNQIARMSAIKRKALGDSVSKQGRWVSAVLAEKLDAVHELDGKSKKAIDHILDAMIDEAMTKRNMIVAHQIIDRVEGKTPQSIDVTHTHEINLDALSEADLKQLRVIVAKAEAGDVDAQRAPTYTDVEYEDVTPDQ